MLQHFNCKIDQLPAPDKRIGRNGQYRLISGQAQPERCRSLGT